MDDRPKRKPIRLKAYDYAANGAYFLTLCAYEKRCLFGRVAVGANCVRPRLMPSDLGGMVENELLTIPRIYETVAIDKYVIMPNHIHMIVVILQTDGRTQFAPTISRIVKQFKGAVTKRTGYAVWQKSFFDHIIRDEEDYRVKWKYIDTNPEKWLEDQYYRGS